ncbi:MAG TPA: hemolysin family protein [candidate division Zixibacteria bacterium]|nr:hemolysin family protein [candidate division Zixibacteria bacterium]
MDNAPLIQIVAILLLICANGFFAMSEFSIIASRRSRLRQQAEDGRPGAEAAEKLNRKPDEFLATIQIGITLVGTLAGVTGGATIVEWLRKILTVSSIPAVAGAAKSLSVVIVTILITVSTVTLGELVPKYIALSNPERYARWIARPITIFTQISLIFARLLSAVSNFILKILGVKHNPARSAVSEDEINLMIFEGREKGVFDETEERLIKSVFDFADSPVSRAMTPRTDVVGIDIALEPAQMLRKVVENGYSRYPVYQDTIDNVVGILYAKDLLEQELNTSAIVMADLIRKPTFVPESMPLSALLSKFRRHKGRVAIVLDEFGGTAGIVCLQDIIEELVGEIQDEDDKDPPELVKHSDNVAYADGSVWPGAINELMHCRLPEADHDTLAGLIIETMGRLPEKGDSIVIADMNITVLVLEHRRVARLKLERINKSNDNGANGKGNGRS